MLYLESQAWETLSIFLSICRAKQKLSKVSEVYLKLFQGARAEWTGIEIILDNWAIHRANIVKDYWRSIGVRLISSCLLSRANPYRNLFFSFKVKIN